MPGSVRRAIIVIAASVLLLALQVGALAEVTVTYLGETPDTGSSSYQGDYASELWDYVYTISPTSEEFGPTWFFVVTQDPAVVIYDTDGAWTGEWVSSFNYPQNPLNGLPGVRWRWQTTGTPLTGTFHFASRCPPVLRPWTARGMEQTIYNGDGITWSASPEPASMALTGLCLFGVAAWKRRRTGPKKD